MTRMLPLLAAVLVPGILPAADAPDIEQQKTALLDVLPTDLAARDWVPLFDALKDAGANWVEFQKAFEALTSDKEKRDLMWLAENMPHIDRLEVTREFLVDNVRDARKASSLCPIKPSEDMYRGYILTYRIADEPIAPYRAEIRRAFQDHLSLGDPPQKVAAFINQWVQDGLASRDYEYFGGMAAPVQILTGRVATESERVVFALAALRAYGIPARMVTCPGVRSTADRKTWLEFFDGLYWIPMYLDAPKAMGDVHYVERNRPQEITIVRAATAFEREDATNRYSDTGTLAIRFTSDAKPMKAFSKFSICIPGDGQWTAISDELELATDDDGWFETTLGDGPYTVTASARTDTGSAYVVMQQALVKPETRTEITIDLTCSLPGSKRDER
jgi:hypothetical protein